MRKPRAEQKVGREGRGRVKFVRGEAALYPYHIPSDSFLASPSCASVRPAGNVFRQIKYVQFAIAPPLHPKDFLLRAIPGRLGRDRLQGTAPTLQALRSITGCSVRPSRPLHRALQGVTWLFRLASTGCQVPGGPEANTPKYAGP
jgi:hypothetical protein